MNAARSLVGFADLTVGQADNDKLPIDEATAKTALTGTAYVNSVCAALKSTEVSPAQSAALDGTYAYAVQDSADCEAAVEYWKEAFPNFKGLPPQYTDGAELYKNPQNVSFISLFNPQENPKVDCAYFTCPAQQDSKKQKSEPVEDEEAEPPTEEDSPTVDEGEPDSNPGTTNPKVDCAYFTCPAQQDSKKQKSDPVGNDGTDPPGEGDLPSVDEGEPDSRPEDEDESTTDKEVKALLCVTTPNALTTNNAPYTQVQWDQITAGFNKNAAPALSTFLGFAAVAVSCLLL
ncbi:SAG family member [Eimeria mitis]|uniref:SAG family member n=1 Tax=Eimeria mitis TaxID=44415 RepID=U6KEX8_9EIME|nr:SAG family member [Eimeria mitis]CDJ34023.1 SAG family member [Eimeria mitis]